MSSLQPGGQEENGPHGCEGVLGVGGWTVCDR